MISGIRAFISRTRTWVSPGTAEADFAAELESHLEMLTEENLQKGMTAEQARREARLKLGGLTQLKETHRELRGFPFLETIFQDTRYAFRMLRKNPGFTAVAILTLALGIGANTAIFSVVYAVLLKPLPYAHAGQLVTVFQSQKQEGVAVTGWSYPNYEELRRENHVFSELAGATGHQLTLTGQGEPTVVNTSVVTAELFTLFEVKPLLGRVFYPEDGKRGAPPVVILGENLWRGTFGGDPNIIGKSIVLDQRAFTVVGVVPSSFRFPNITQSEKVWIPLPQDPMFGGWMERRGGHWLLLTGRLRPGVSRAQAQAELDRICSSLAKEFPAQDSGWTAGMFPLQDLFVGDVKNALLVLLGAVGLVLLIACANIANLLLSRATLRSKEMAVRATLGAGHRRIIRQLLSESAVLGLLGGMAGIALAYGGVVGLSSLLPQTLPRVNPIRVDDAVLIFALILCGIASVAFGLFPALFTAKSDLQTSLREGGGRSSESLGRRRARNILAVAEISLAMVLLVTAGLLLRSFSKLVTINPGFQAQHLIKADISLPQFQYSTPQQWSSFTDDLLGRVQAQAGLRDAAMAVPLPLDEGNVNLGFQIVGDPPLAPGTSLTADFSSVSPDYFHVMQIPLLRGRSFTGQDVSSAPRVTIISAELARRFFPVKDPVGRELAFNFPPAAPVPWEIVGVVGDVRDISLGQKPGPMMYVPFDQAPFWGGQLVVRSNLGVSAVAAAIRQEVQKIDKDLPVTDVAKLPDLLDANIAQEKFRAVLLGLFAVMALLLAATGIFGLISYSVSCRTNEIGIRAALGASRGAILRLILRETMLLAFAGLALGFPCALIVSHLISHLLFGVSANDPSTLVAVAFILSAVAVLAGFIPARRAMQVNPTVALRHE